MKKNLVNTQDRGVRKTCFFSPDLFKHYSRASLNELEILTSFIIGEHKLNNIYRLENLDTRQRKETTAHHTEVKKRKFEFLSQNQL